MEFRTPVRIPTPTFAFSYTDRSLLLGSCFAENIGRRLQENKFTVDINPFGILYNPASVAEAVRMLLNPERFTETDLFHHEGMYHSWMHHSQFSLDSTAGSLDGINRRLEDSATKLHEATRLVVTLGTAYVYRLKDDGRVVANCHKLPERLFDRERLTTEAIVTEWKTLLFSLWEHLPELKVLFTVSPIRHWKDGAHGNQLSKATLLLAVDHLHELFPDRVAYFPAYEIVMDELRDYRFYADDMLHPSTMAVDYIWERFCESFLTADTQSAYRDWQDIRRALNHRPFHPDSEAYRQFVRQTLLKMEQLREKFPSFDLANEYTLMASKIDAL